jgi:hypothetical protein
MNMKAQEVKQSSQLSFEPEVCYTAEELARLVKLHPATIRKMFFDEEGVLRLGHAGSIRKRQYISLRIPASVARRVLQRMTVTSHAR